VLVAEDAVYDRSQVSHAVNLFDMSEKYADVAPAREVLARLAAVPARAAQRAPAHAA
jgi:isochorismate hydrolase